MATTTVSTGNDSQASSTGSMAGNATVRRGDPYIWGLYITLIIISLVETYSASSREIRSTGLSMYTPFIKHVLMLAGGFVCLWFIQRWHYKYFKWPIFFFAAATICCMVYVYFKGDIINGARRSFSIMGFSVQPAEMAKLSIVTVIALLSAYIRNGKQVKSISVFISAFMVLLYCVFLYQQGLTNTIIIFAISLAMIVVCGINWKHIGIVFLAYGIAAGTFYAFSHAKEEAAVQANTATTEEQYDASGTEAKDPTDRQATRKHRLSDWEWLSGTPLVERPLEDLNPQDAYSRMAQVHGGVFGVGPGNSRERSRLPLAFSDYIYSIIVEELGIVGGIFVILVYLALLGRAGKIAYMCNKVFPCLLMLGMAVMITVQALAHIAINTGAFPVSGQPLPLISKGGSSIIMTSIAFGIMLSVSRYAIEHKDGKMVAVQDDETPDALGAVNPSQY